MSKNTISVIAALILGAIVLYPVFLAGDLYSLASLQEKFAPKEETEFSKQYFTFIQSHNIEAIKKYLDPKVADAQLEQKFDKVAKLFPNESPKSIKFIGDNAMAMDGVTRSNLSLEYEFSNTWDLANIVLEKQGSTYRVLGFNIQQLKDSLENLTRFTFWGQDSKHYLVFTAAILLLLLDIYALVLCIKTPIPKRKWLWIIFILIGFGTVAFNWMTGEFYFDPLSIKLPLVQFSQMLYQPFMIHMLIPVGAIVFLLRRKKWLV